MMAMTNATTVENARAKVCVAPSATIPGAKAPKAVTPQPAIRANLRMARRPRRSARATIASESSTPTRTPASNLP